MDIEVLKEKFSSDALSVIEAEVREAIESTFSTLDLSENAHLIEPFYVQPMFYATLLNYYTMGRQHSTVSLLEMASDTEATDQDREAIAESFASELGIDLTGQTVSNKLMIINSAISTSDGRIKKLQSTVKGAYTNASLIVSGASKEMFRNSPDHKMFADTRFAIPFLYENMTPLVATSEILNQPISISDANRYENMIHSGRSGNSADVFLSPNIEVAQYTLIVGEGETGSVDLPLKKYAYLEVEASTGKENMSFGFSTDLNIGFEDRGITISASDRCVATIQAYYFEDDSTVETSIKSQFPTLDITFSGMVPIYVDIVLQNETGLASFMDSLRGNENTKKWMAIFRSESSKLSRFGNKSIDMSGDMMVNPVVSRPVGFFNGNIAISGNSIMSWVTEANSFVIPRKVTILETDNVTFF